ncbi:MAG: Holliday junction branch migration DNA helicase RuvB [Planctomycetota bacterium]|nr:MAG: Holliday junction branch migration DNA helicase RuvB [Planctomycetota bacterium]
MKPNPQNSVFSPHPEDDHWENTLRPQRLEEFLGQQKVVANLKIYLQAAQKRQEVLDHILFSGAPGLGKTTLAHLIATEMGVTLRATSGPILEKAGDLAGLLTSLQKGDILFIDEIHRLKPIVEEYLYSAMEDFCIDVMLDQGPNARSITIHLPPFTLIGATTREGLLSAPFRARFGILEKLDLYPPNELEQILLRSAKILNVHIDPDAAQLLSQRCRGTPRIANRIIRRIRDLAEVQSGGHISVEIAQKGLEMLGVDEHGLEEMDRKILKVLLQHQGGPVGLKTIAVSVGEEERTIEDVYEPYLIQQGFLLKTPRGRVASPKTLQYFRQTQSYPQSFLF